MTTKEFIDKAIEGGWKQEVSDWFETYEMDSSRMVVNINSIFLDPTAWEAVGKVEGWTRLDRMKIFYMDTWHNTVEYKMHQMIDHLIEEGGTITSYLETL